MITLEEYNIKAKQEIEAKNAASEAGKPSGVTCPECGKELLEHIGKLVCMDPWTRKVSCSCGFEGGKIIP